MTAAERTREELVSRYNRRQCCYGAPPPKSKHAIVEAKRAARAEYAREKRERREVRDALKAERAELKAAVGALRAGAAESGGARDVCVACRAAPAVMLELPCAHVTLCRACWLGPKAAAADADGEWEVVGEECAPCENGEVSASVDETNRVRALLGLKPLQGTAKPAARCCAGAASRRARR